MKTGSMAVFVALIFAASGAFAQSPAATRKFYVGVQVGQSTLDRQSSDLGANFDDHDVAYSLLAGYRFSRFYALELGYNDLGGFSAEFPNTCPAAPSCPPDIGNTALKSLVLNNVLVWPIAEHFHLKGTIGMNFYEVSGSLLTVAWGLEGVALLAAGFSLRDRVQRLSGMALLLFCILKLFLWDLRHLETLPRILSFIVLGLILVGVSWIYTRFRERVERYL